MLNVALVGVSGFADCHYRELLSLREMGLIRIVAATVINQEAEASKCSLLRELGCAVYDDYRRMLSEEGGRIELCVIPTGIHLHASMTIDALRAGCHVLVEKPAAATMEEISRMREEERWSHRSIAIAYQHLYAPEVMKMKRLLLDGKIGRPLAVKGLGLWPRAENYYARNGWAGRLKCGESWVLDSPFNNAFAHWLNLTCFLAGRSAETAANPRAVQAELYRARAIESADTACLRIETDEGPSLLFYVTHSCSQTVDAEVEVRGTEGALCWRRDGIFHRFQGGCECLFPVSSEEASRRSMYEAVLRRIAGEEAFVCGLAIAEKQSLCANAAFLSSAIHDISPEFLVQNGEAPSDLVAIRDIEPIFRAAFDQELLWSQMAVPWARPGRTVRADEFTKIERLSLPKALPDAPVFQVQEPAEALVKRG